MSQYTWLVTGASSGLGAEIALAALKAGHGVIATARNVSKARESYPDIEKQGGAWLKLDVTSPETQTIVDKVVKEKNVNVVVNNAGYALKGVLEDLTETQMRAQFETNVFGPLFVAKGAIPTFRARRSGTIVNISSTSGMTGSPGFTLYAASKFALEGASEAMAAELAPFGIRILVVEPGAFRTNFQVAAIPAQLDGGAAVSEPYKGTPADDVMKLIGGMHGKQPGDPVKGGQAIVEVVTGASRGKEVEGVFRLPLGKDAVQRANAKLKSFGGDVEKTKHISEWAVFEQ